MFRKTKEKITSIFLAKKRSGKLVLLFFVLLATAFFIPSPAHAAAPLLIAGGVAALLAVIGGVGALAAPIVAVLQLIAACCTFFVSLAARFLGFMLQPNLYNFTSERIINDGWVTCRDICNMFFLIILLFIAFCTILKIEKYHARKTLLTLIIMALLINFSKPIAIFIFDGAQLLMNTFLKTNGNYEITVTRLTRISDIVYNDLPKLSALIVGNKSNVQIGVQALFTIIFMFVYGISLFILGIYLLIRIVAMWLIIIVSPFAFLSLAVPGFEKISSDWWNALLKYSFIGPAIAFFLFLSVKLSESYFITIAQKMGTSKGESIVSMANFIPFMVVIIFLYASIIIAQKFGIAFAGAITSRADKILKGGISRLTGARYAGNFLKSHYKHATTAGKEKLKQKFPTLHKIFTDEGREKSRQQFWGGGVFKTTTKEQQLQKGVAEAQEKGKKEGHTEKNWEKILEPANKMASAADKMYAALALAKEGKLKDGAQYKAGLDALAAVPALKTRFEKDAAKKNVHAVIDEELERTDKTDPAKIQAVYNKHLNSLNPAEIGDQKLDFFAKRDSKNNLTDYKPEFKTWANEIMARTGKGRIESYHPGVKNDLAKKMSGEHFEKFQEEFNL